MPLRAKIISPRIRERYSCIQCALYDHRNDHIKARFRFECSKKCNDNLQRFERAFSTVNIFFVGKRWFEKTRSAKMSRSQTTIFSPKLCTMPSIVISIVILYIVLF